MAQSDKSEINREQQLVQISIHKYILSVLLEILFIPCFICVYSQVTWLKDGRLISWRDRLYTQTKKRLRGNTEGQDQDAREDQLVASLFVASVRRDATFTCRIETNPPVEENMQVTVRGETRSDIISMLSVYKH